MKQFQKVSALGAAALFGAVAMAAQTLLLRRFLWRVESAEAGVALFLSCWLFWSGLGAALAATPVGRRITGAFAKAVWLPVLGCGALYFAQYALLGTLREWMGVAAYERFPLARLALGCLLANGPFCFVAGLVIPTVCRRLAESDLPVSRAFAWEALGAALGGLGVTLLLVLGVAPDPRDEAEWFRYFPQAQVRPGRFETGGGTTFYGSHGGTFYALTSGGVSEILPEGDRAIERAALLLSQRPYAKEVLLLGRVPLAVGLALESLRPDLAVTWCPCDPAYGVRLLEAVHASGRKTRVRASGETPQRVLGQWPEGAFDGVMVVPPAATSLEGASWRTPAFAGLVRRVTRRTGVALFALDCEAAALTPERAALIEITVRGARQSWPEAGVFAAGAGGWWVAAQVPKLAYGAEDACARFALLKRGEFPAEAVAPLYDVERALRLALSCPALKADAAVLLPVGGGTEAVMAAGLAAAVRSDYPDTAPGAWLPRFASGAGVRLAGLLLVVLGMLPVALGGGAHASRRLVAAWLAASGALGLAASLMVLYRLQLRFGSLYLFAGAGSCLYLTGLFCGNRLLERVVRRLGVREGRLRVAVMAVALVQAGVVVGVALASAHVASAMGLVGLNVALGAAAGGAAPVALALCGEDAAESAAVFVLADALGAAVAGLAFAALVPLAGLWHAAGCFVALACGFALCAACGSRYARLTAGLALAASLAVLGRQVNAIRAETGDPRTEAGQPFAAPRQTASGAAGAESRARAPAAWPGVPRRLDVPLIREQMRKGVLATNAAAYWE